MHAKGFRWRLLYFYFHRNKRRSHAHVFTQDTTSSNQHFRFTFERSNAGNQNRFLSISRIRVITRSQMRGKETFRYDNLSLLILCIIPHYIIINLKESRLEGVQKICAKIFLSYIHNNTFLIDSYKNNCVTNIPQLQNYLERNGNALRDSLK